MSQARKLKKKITYKKGDVIFFEMHGELLEISSDTPRIVCGVGGKHVMWPVHCPISNNREINEEFMRHATIEDCEIVTRGVRHAFELQDIAVELDQHRAVFFPAQHGFEEDIARQRFIPDEGLLACACVHHEGEA